MSAESTDFDPPFLVRNGRRYTALTWTKCDDCALNGRVFCDGAPCVPADRADKRQVMFRKEEE